MLGATPGSTPQRAAESAIAAELDALGRPTEPGLHAALGRAYRDGELVYTASSMPIRDQEAFLGGADAEVLFLANRGANGIDGLLSSGIGAAAASGRPTVIVTGDLGLLHDLGGLAAIARGRDPGADRRRQQRRRRDLRVPAAGRPARPRPSSTPCSGPRARSTSAPPPSLFGLRYTRVDDLGELGTALAAGTGLIEVPVDRAENVGLHRRLTEAATAALSGS